jgi:hypothetical protein
MQNQCNIEEQIALIFLNILRKQGKINDATYKNILRKKKLKEVA